MHDFHYVGNQLHCEGVALAALVKKHGTPLYVYSQRTLTRHFQELDRAMAPVDHLVCFAVKSNSNQSVLRTVANLGGGFAIVRSGELQRVLAEPRYPSFMNIRKASKLQIPVLDAVAIGAEAAKVGKANAAAQWLKVFPLPARTGTCEIITGDSPQAIAAALADKLMAEKVI